MTNFEYYKNDILQILHTGRDISFVNNKIVPCASYTCNLCDFNNSVDCMVNSKLWLYQEHKIMPVITKRMRKFCEVVETGWLGKNKDEIVCWYKYKPVKDDDSWIYNNNLHRASFDPIFFLSPEDTGFLHWEDPEPWAVEDILKLEVENESCINIR